MGAGFAATGIDHVVLAVTDVEASAEFYRRVLGMEAEAREGGWTLSFGPNMISLRPILNMPEIAASTTVGSGNFCVLTDAPMPVVLDHLAHCGVETVLGPVPRSGAAGMLLSVYVRDPDGNLVEVANAIEERET
jgi:catechol 2,3-dioxygenase-like lactoylglutathione lyase family enzyme